VSERLERILASLGTPERIDQETPREIILAAEVRRLRAQWDGLRANVDAEREAAGCAARCTTTSTSRYYYGQDDALEVVLILMDEATAAAWTGAAERGATMDRMSLMGLALQEVQAWQTETFGDRSPPGARVAKLREEVEEVAAEVAMGPAAFRERVAEELADVLFVAVDIARAFDLTPAELEDAVRAKLRRNRARAWAQAADGTFKGTKATP
jgi:NTP pyrophosphatase (non-canonical NTP hydrolase)